MYYPKDPANYEQSHQKLASMACIGHMTAKTCKIWVRLYRPGKWWLVVSKKRLSGDLDTLDGLQVDAFVAKSKVDAISCSAKEITTDTDNSHTFLVRGLEPDTTYYYAVIADLTLAHEVPRRTEIGHQAERSFRSLPSDLSKISMGYYSCHDPFSTSGFSEGAWADYFETLKEKSAVLSLGGGDQVYVDANSKDDMYSVWKWLAKYKHAVIKDFSDNGQLDEPRLIEYFVKIYRSYYRLYWNFPNLLKTYAQFPQYMMWDDHEVMDGWGSYERKERRKLLNKLFQDDDEDVNDRLIDLMFIAAKQVYFEYQHSHNPTTTIDLDEDANEQCEWDYGFKLGSHAFYVLDTRGHHDYERHEQENAILGDRQMARFQDWLDTKAKNAKSLVVASAVPIVHWGALVSSLDIGPAKDDLRDEWEHETNHAERNKLLNTLLSYTQKTGARVVVLSGDVHSASIYSIENDNIPGAVIYNATSSAISRKPAPSKAEFLIRKTGKIKGYEGGYATRHYALSGKHNFLSLTLDALNEKIDIELFWPGGDSGELTKKRVTI